MGKVLWRILIFMLARFRIVTIFPWNEIGSNGSPFVTFAKIGITAAAGIINFVVLTAVLSGCNSGMYSCGRRFTRWRNRQLPAAVAKSLFATACRSRAWRSLIFDFAGRFCLNYIIPNPQRAFVYVYSASVPGMVPWFVILISQLRCRAHKEAIVIIPFHIMSRGRTI